MTRPSPNCRRCSGTGWVWLTAEIPASPRAAEASCPDCCGPTPETVADWREAHHWSPQLRPCRHCGRPTHLRDDDGTAAHKACAERAATVAAPAGSAGVEAGGGR